MAHPAPRPAQPFSEAQDPALTSGLFWARLFTYRSAFLLGGLWLAFVCTSAIAYRLLMFNEPVADTTYLEAPLVVEAAPAPGATPAPEPEGAAEGAPSGGVLVWALFSLVGLCAFGSFVLAQQIKAASRPPKRPPAAPRLVTPTAPPTPRPGMLPRRGGPPQPKRLAPYVPQRDALLAPGVLVDEGMGPAQRPPTSLAQPVTAPRRPSDPPAAAPRDPAVVPTQADLPLDYPEGSVAHVLDVRQRRSLSSFM